jgi:hypothetical protein
MLFHLSQERPPHLLAVHPSSISGRYEEFGLKGRKVDEDELAETLAVGIRIDLD